MLVVATICQPIAATPVKDEEKIVKAERYPGEIGDLASVAVSVSENDYDKVTLTEEEPYKVFKFVPTETKEYSFSSSYSFSANNG